MSLYSSLNFLEFYKGLLQLFYHMNSYDFVSGVLLFDFWPTSVAIRPCCVHQEVLPLLGRTSLLGRPPPICGCTLGISPQVWFLQTRCSGHLWRSLCRDIRSYFIHEWITWLWMFDIFTVAKLCSWVAVLFLLSYLSRLHSVYSPFLLRGCSL